MLLHYQLLLLLILMLVLNVLLVLILFLLEMQVDQGLQSLESMRLSPFKCLAIKVIRFLNMLLEEFFELSRFELIFLDTFLDLLL